MFYRSFYEAIKDLPKDIQGEIYEAIMEFGLNDNELENMKPVTRSIFTLIRPQIEANKRRYENGKKGGRPKSVEAVRESECKKRNLFTPPSLVEVKEYCRARANKVDGERFINFYQSKDWMVGKNKMKDWRAAVRSWERTEGFQREAKQTNISKPVNSIHYEQF